MKELILKKCLKCGNIIEIVKDENYEDKDLICCGEKMVTLNPNSVDASIEKHVPTYEIIDNQIVASVNHVMEEEHYIEWIAMVSDTKIGKKFLKPNDKPQVTFPYIKGSTLYAYCNKHGLWSKEVM